MRARKIAGYLIVGVCLTNLVASLLMLFVLGPATMAGGEAEIRIRYILEHQTSVRLGWGSWIIASLSLTYFFYLMIELIPGNSRSLRGGLANLCYGLAGCLATVAMFRAGSFSRLIRITSVPLWGFTLFMSYGSFARRSDLLPFVVGSTMAIFIVWSFLIGLELVRGES